jgi:hypothetical protein
MACAPSSGLVGIVAIRYTGTGDVSLHCDLGNQLGTDSNCTAIGDDVTTLPHATGTCKQGAAAIVSCDAGYFDADGQPRNGCEVGADEFEPNDARDAASEISMDDTGGRGYLATIDATVAPENDSDWYAIDSPAVSRVMMTYELAAAPGVTLNARVNGYPATSAVTDSSGTATIGFTGLTPSAAALNVTGASPGKYRLRVTYVSY